MEHQGYLKFLYLFLLHNRDQYCQYQHHILLCILYFIPDDLSRFNGPLSFSEKVDKATKIKLLFIDKFIYKVNPIKLVITVDGYGFSKINPLSLPIKLILLTLAAL